MTFRPHFSPLWAAALAVALLCSLTTGCTSKTYYRVTLAPPISPGETSQPIEEVKASARGVLAKSEATNLEASMTKTRDAKGNEAETRSMSAGRLLGESDPASIKAVGDSLASAADAIANAAAALKAPPLANAAAPRPEGTPED